MIRKGSNHSSEKEQQGPLHHLSNQLIFLSPLDWGLGHSTRCVPIIERLSVNNRVVLGVTKVNANYYKTHFPQLQQLPMPSSNIRYSTRLPLVFKLLLQLPRFLFLMRREHKLLNTYIRVHRFDLIVSDSRYGCYSRRCKSVLISHQLQLQVSVFSGWINSLHRTLVNQFREVWVPDYADPNLRLSGSLSEAGLLKIPVHYIGPQSALQNYAGLVVAESFDVLVLLSGVEPQRSVFENLLLQVIPKLQKKCLFIRGTQDPPQGHLTAMAYENFMTGEALARSILGARLIICRSGYSTLMDLHVLGKKNLVLVPTPGQTEQEYLAGYWSKTFHANYCEQKKVLELNF